jgi:peptidoglycan-associated lipoprotein
MKKLVISLVLLNLLAACASNKPAETTAAPADTGAKGTTAASKTDTATTTSVAGDPLNDPASILAKRSVYYPFDVDAVQDADKPVVQAHGKYLASNPNRNVRLEGNCDERGSNEYNLGLGQRRADGVKKMLELSGAKAGQMESVSYGEEKPVASGHDEASWSQNRRTDIKYAK